MSIAILKKKTAAKYNNMSVNVPQFSLQGGYRNQGWVGQTSLSRSLANTPMRGDTARGSGGCCGTYNRSTIVQSGVKSTNDNHVMKDSVLSNNGMIATKYRWIGRPQPYTSVKSDDNHNLNSQSDYINDKTKETQACSYSNPSIPSTATKCNTDLNCDIFKNRINTPYNNRSNIQKDVGPKSESEYISNLNSRCVTNDLTFQETQNQSTSKSPFGC